MNTGSTGHVKHIGKKKRIGDLKKKQGIKPPEKPLPTGRGAKARKDAERVAHSVRSHKDREIRRQAQALPKGHIAPVRKDRLEDPEEDG